MTLFGMGITVFVGNALVIVIRTFLYTPDTDKNASPLIIYTDSFE